MWLPLVPHAVWAFHRRHLVPAFLVGLGLCATATSILLWQHDYSRHAAHWDADLFGVYAKQLADHATQPALREAARAWMAGSIHAHNPLVPLVVAAPVAAGVPVEHAYLALSAVASMASLWLLHHLLRRRLALPSSLSLLAVALAGCHLVLVRSFARPVTDAMGHLLTVAALDLTLARLGGRDARRTAALALLGLLQPLARPQGLAYIPFFTFAALLADRWRDGRLEPRDALRTVAVLGGLPVIALAVLFLAFGWWSNLQALLEAARRFLPWYTLRDFGASSLAVVQALPLLWIAAWRRRGDRGLQLLVLWAAYYVAVLVAVRAPFWTRHFLPVLPTVMALTAVALGELRGRSRAIGVALVALLAFANVVVLVREIGLRTELSLALSRFVTLG
jgi:hypothetical protein